MTRRAARPHRIALSLPDDLRAELQAFSEVSGKPVSAVIVELLRSMQPQLSALTKMQGQVKAGKASAARRTLEQLIGGGIAGIFEAGRQVELFKGKRK